MTDQNTGPIARDALHAQLQQLIAPVVHEAGFELVRVQFTAGKSATLQIMAEDPATGQITIDECAQLSRLISDVLDESDPIDDAYDLEVSSPGIDRPLTRLDDFDRWAGHVAQFTLRDPIEDKGRMRRHFRGQLLGLTDGAISLRLDDVGDISVPFDGIEEAQLLLTDRLIAESAALQADDDSRQLKN